MRKISIILFFMVIGVFLGCPTEELECTDSNNFVNLNVLTTDNVDSIHFFLNKKQVCHSNIGVFHNILICEDSSAKGYLSAIMADDAPDECDTPNKKLIWKGFHCFIGNSSDHVDIDSSILSLEIFSSAGSSMINTSQVILGGRHINIIPETDTTKWFGHDQNPIRPYFDEFNTPALSMRMGCNNNYCMAALPMTQKEICRDK